MARTISGWTPIPNPYDSRLTVVRVPGTSWSIRAERTVAPLFAAFASDFNRKVAKIDGPVLDDWSWSPMRTGRASSAISDHCAGRAIDINAIGTGSQAKGNRNIGDGWWRRTKKHVRMRMLLRKYKVFNWGALSSIGGVYNRLSDPMHVFVKPGTSDAQIRAVIRKLGIRPDGKRKLKGGKWG